MSIVCNYYVFVRELFFRDNFFIAIKNMFQFKSQVTWIFNDSYTMLRGKGGGWMDSVGSWLPSSHHRYNGMLAGLNKKLSLLTILFLISSP